MKKKIYFENLDGLRFFAFFAVFLNHSLHTEIPAIKEQPFFHFIDELWLHGHLGVNFFFVLSGFLITFLLLHEQQLRGKINVGYFYIRRILRIWPMYFFCIFFGFLLFPIFKTLLGQVAQETANPWLYMTFLSNFNDMFQKPDSSVLSVLWSVAIEEQFYLCWPLLLYFLPRKTYLTTFVTIIVGSIVFRSFYCTDKSVLYYHTFSVISDMAVGGLFAYFSFQKAAFMERFKQISKHWIAIIYVLGFSIVCFNHVLFAHPIAKIFERLILSLFFIFIVLEQNYAHHSLFKVGNFKRISYWGRYTYGLYCLHSIAILITLQVSKVLHTNTTIFGVMVLETLASFFLSLAISWLSFHYFESYFLKLKNRFSFIVKQ